MGDRRKQALRVQFDGKLKLEFHGALDHERLRAAALLRTGRGLPFDGEGKSRYRGATPRPHERPRRQYE